MFLVSLYDLCGGYLIDSATAETVEPSNDRSLESWTDCPVNTISLAQYEI